jgi:hypothetical protein
MIPDDPNLKSQYRMPRVFGALPGPRNVPRDKQHLPNNQKNLVVSVTALTDQGRLSELLPPDCVLDGEPLLTVTMTFMSNIGWLGGHGYSILSVGFKIALDSKSRGKVSGTFLPVLWENLADPIITGREELGFAKLYADIPPPVIVGNRYMACAGWQGFRFFEIEVSDLKSEEAGENPPTGSFHYKYIPRTGSLGIPDTAYLEYAPADKQATGYGGLNVTRRLTGEGEFRFHSARWEDVPFQYPIINTLAALPIIEIRSASVTHLEAHGAIGDPSAGYLTQID